MIDELLQIAEGRSAFPPLRAGGAVGTNSLPFRAIVSILDTWQGPGLYEAYARLGKIIPAWPAYNRIAPWSWSAALTDEEPKPYWAWVAHRQSHPHVFFHDCYRPPHDTIIALPGTARARLDKLSHVGGIVRPPASTESVFLKDRWGGRRFRKEIGNAKYDDLRHLYLASPAGYLPREAEHLLRALAETGRLAQLETLVMDGYYASMTLDGLQILCEA